jgi:hypothetical protein
MSQRVLLIGRSRQVLDEAIDGLLELGYEAEGTNEFESVGDRYDARELDLVVFGGAVPLELKAQLRDELAAANPAISFVDGLAGIPGLIVNQVRGAFSAAARVASFCEEDRMILLSLEGAAHLRVTLWWVGDSLVLFEGHLPAGDKRLVIPDDVPAAAYATVEIGAAVEAFAVRSSS